MSEIQYLLGRLASSSATSVEKKKDISDSERINKYTAEASLYLFSLQTHFGLRLVQLFIKT